MVKLVLGVDPGLTGGIALLEIKGSVGAIPRLVNVFDMPVSKVGRAKKESLDVDALASMVRDLDPDVSVIERVAAAPGAGVSSMFNFGMGFGVLRGLFAGLGVPVQLVAPPVWKGGLRLPGGPDKSKAREAAMKVWPDQAGAFKRVKDHGRAEAALIALYGIRSGLALRSQGNVLSCASKRVVRG